MSSSSDSLPSCASSTIADAVNCLATDPLSKHRGIGVRHVVLEIRRTVAVRVQRATVLRESDAAARRGAREPCEDVIDARRKVGGGVCCAVTTAGATVQARRRHRGDAAAMSATCDLPQGRSDNMRHVPRRRELTLCRHSPALALWLRPRSATDSETHPPRALITPATMRRLLRSFALPLLATVGLSSIAAAQIPPGGPPAQPPAANAPAQGVPAPRRAPSAPVQPGHHRQARTPRKAASRSTRSTTSTSSRCPTRCSIATSCSSAACRAVPAGMGGFAFAGSEAARRVVRWSKVNDRLNLAEHQLRRRRRRLAADLDQRAQQQLRADPRGVSHSGILARQHELRPRRHRLLRRRHARHLRDERRRAPTVQRSPLRSGAQLREQRARRSRSTSKCARCRRSTPRDVARRPHEQHDLARDAAVDDPAAESPDARRAHSTSASATSPCTRVNYGLDEQKAATETFITRWRLEPKDPAAYARGELVEPIKPIVYYIDPGNADQVASLREGRRRVVAEGVRESRIQERDSRQGPAEQGTGSRLGSGRRARIDGALGGEPRAQRRWDRARPIRAAARSSTARSLVSQPHAVVSQPSDDRDGRGESAWRARSTFPKS